MPFWETPTKENLAPGALNRPIFPEFPDVLTFLGDFNPQKLPSGRLEVLWELDWRIELEEIYPVMGLTSLEVESEPSFEGLNCSRRRPPPPKRPSTGKISSFF